MSKIKLIIKCLVLTATVIFAGCASGPQVRERYFWPPPPDTPRIEWLGAFSNEGDLRQASLFEAVVGETMQAELERPLNIAADGNGKVYVSDFKQQCVYVFDMKLRKLHTLAAERALGMFEQLSGVAVDGDGNVYVGDAKTRKVIVFDQQEKAVAAIDLSKELASIASMSIDKPRKRMLVTDVKGHRILVYDLAAKTVLFVLGSQETGKDGAGDLHFNYPTSATTDQEGNILVCDSMNARIVRFTPQGKYLSEFGQRGDAVGDFNIAKGVAVDSEGHIYVTDGKAHRVNIFNDKGEVLLAFGGAYSFKGAGYDVRPGGFLLPNAIYIDQNDTIYIVDQMNSRFQMYQYVTEKYLKEHPITEQAPAAKPVAPSPTGTKNK
ncbi:6-bladed beta-propeller [Pelotalea chapellei]|uniref:6-bladed beta-propeller n=1 Tax=Pelotalea chapellei TaxID=44671 RepID=A0ABS5UA72_9BACT|nr:6-bladed beta-propeller [Pelotalea chapellei]MBT1072554.1 6-bladed beta-propeller [Pelotalea chapellei]